MTLDVETGQVYEAHPVADLFPMLADDELAELADSIRERGLDHPIVLDRDGRVLDGRNRLAACHLAGVQPRFETYEGDDAEDYALRSGIVRRHLTTGARAMIAAKAAKIRASKNGQPDLDVINAAEVARQSEMHKARIADALTVLDWAADHVDAVIAGAPLSKAVEEARRRKHEAEELEAKLARLRADAPDLAELVAEERMAVDDALAAVAAREEKARNEAEAQRAAEQAARQEALNAWNQASDYLNAALSYVKTYTPPTDTDIYATIADFRRRVDELHEITHAWEDDGNGER